MTKTSPARAHLRFILILAVLLCAVADRRCFATDLYWTASDAADGNFDLAANWSTTAGACGSGTKSSAKPGAGDKLFFTGQCRTKALAGGDFIVSGWNMTGYTYATGPITGLITFAGHKLTINGDFFMDGGKLNISGNPLYISGNFKMTGGDVSEILQGLTFNGTDTKSAQSFDVPTSSTPTFLNVNLSDASSTAVTIARGNLIVTGAFNAHSGKVNGGTLELRGSTYSFNPQVAGTSDVLFSGTNDQTISNATNAFTSGAWTISCNSLKKVSLNGDMSITGALMVTSGTLDIAGRNLTAGSTTVNGGTVLDSAPGANTIVANDLSILAGSFTATRTTIKGNFLHTGGTFNHNSGTVTFSGSPTITIDVLATGTTFYNINGTSSATITLHSGKLISAGTFSAAGSALTVASGTTFDIGGQSFTSGSLTVNGGTFLAATSGANTIGITNDLSISAGSFMAAPGVTTIGGSFTHSGGTFTHNSGTVTFSKTPTINVLAAGTAFNKINGTSAGPITLQSGMLISKGAFTAANAALTVSGGTLVQDCGQTLTAGVLTLSGGNYLSCNSTATNAANLTLAGIHITSATSVFDYAGTGTITLSGTVVNVGMIRIYGGPRSGSGEPVCSKDTSTKQATLKGTGTPVPAWSGGGHFNLANLKADNQTSDVSRNVYGNSSLTAMTNFVIPTLDCPTNTPVTLTSFSAESYPGAVLLEWKSGHEVDNLGYRVYREEGGQRVLITPSLVAGSALFVGSGIPLTAGRQYSWIDANAHGSSPYWLEDVDLAGHGTWYGPIYPKASESADAAFPRDRLVSPLLNRLGHASASPRQTHRAARPASALAVPQVDPPPAARQAQWALASGPAVKIQVREEGWYRVSARDLIAAGLPAGADPHMLQLYTDGIEQAIEVTPNLTIEFYGRGLDTPESDLRTYWLVNGSATGRRIPKSDALGTGVGSPSFPFTVEQKNRTTYFAALKNGDAQSFFGPVIGNAPFAQPIAISSLDSLAPGDARIEIVLQGVSQTDHSIRVQLNGVDIGTLAYQGQAQQVFQTAIPSAMLREGANQVQFVSSGGDTDITLLDTIRVTYWRKYTADGDGLQLQVASGDTATIRGFQIPEIRVVDTTDPAAPAELNGSVARHDAQYDDGYALSVTPAAAGARTLYAFTENAVRGPVSVTANTPSSLHEAGAGAEVVMIVHPAFLDAVTPLKDLRESQGRTVAVVNVEDIYDEFNFGVRSADAIKDFLMNARAAWKIKPAFVLLVGDASFDTHNYLGFGDFDLVPTKLIETQLMRTASDDWFADADGSGLPAMAVGRLPVRTAAEASTVIRKIVNYEKAGDLAWKSKILLVTDSDSGSDFAQNVAFIKRTLPVSVPVDELVRGVVSDSQMQSALVQRLSEGRGVVNYIGHGSVEIWRGNILTSKSAATLGNGDKLPFVVAMTCLNGFFHDLYTESLAEALLKAEGGGAVAVWASSALTDSDAQLPMDQAILTTLVTGESPTIGEAAVRAKAAAYDRDVRRSWILFGDPLTRIH